MDEAKVISIIKSVLHYVFPVLGVMSMITLFRFTRMHLLFYPDDIPLAAKEIGLLILCLVLFISSMYYKIKSATIIFFICTVWGLINIGGFTLAAVLYYRQLNLDQFI